MLLGSSKELKVCEKRQADALEKMEEEGLITKSKEPDWTALLALAEQKGEEENQNQFYMDEAAYKRLEPHLSKKEGMNSDAYKGYQTGPEYLLAPIHLIIPKKISSVVPQYYSCSLKS